MATRAGKGTKAKGTTKKKAAAKTKPAPKKKAAAAAPKKKKAAAAAAPKKKAAAAAAAPKKSAPAPKPKPQSGGGGGNVKALADRVLKELAAFGAKHPKETFCVLTVDAGYVGVGSVERFAEKKQRYAREWLEAQRPLDAKRLSDEHREDAEHAMRRPRHPLPSIEAWVAEENAERAERMAEGNPYERPETDEYQRLHAPKEMTYPYGELISLRLDRVYLSHYDRDSKDGSPYARAIDDLLAELARRRREIDAALRTTPDFRMVRVEHRY